jgi:hypothetical protein
MCAHCRYGQLRAHPRGGMSAPTENSTAVHSLYAAGYGCKQGEAARPALAALKSKARAGK